MATSSDPIIPPATLQNPEALASAYAVLVLRRNGHWHRQIYMSLHSANKAMERARDNGIEARCVLVELVPVADAPVYAVGEDL